MSDLLPSDNTPKPPDIPWGNQKVHSTDDIETPDQTVNRLNVQGALEAQEAYKEKPGFYESVWKGTTLAHQLYDWYGAPEGIIDDNYTDNIWKQDADEAIKGGLSPFMLPTLESAVSQEHFQQLLERAKVKQEYLKVVSDNAQEDWLGTMSSVFLLNMVDPAALGVGAAAGGLIGAGATSLTFSALRTLNTAYKASKVARLTGFGVGAAAGSAAPEVLNQQLKQIPVSNLDVAFAAAAGTILAGGISGVTVGLRRHPKIWQNVREAGERTVAKMGVRPHGMGKKDFEQASRQGMAEYTAAQEADMYMDPIPGAYDAIPEATIPSAAEPTTTVPHPRHPEVQLPADETGHVILYRGDTENAGVRENKRFINYATTLEEARTNGGKITVIRVPPDDIGKLRARAPEGKVDPNETNFAVPRDIHEAHSKPYLPKPVDAEFTPPPATAPEPEAPASQGLDIAEMSLKDVGDAVGVDLPDMKVALRTGGDDVAPNTNPATYTESIPTGREAKIPGALTKYETPVGSFVVATADPDGSPRGPYRVWETTGGKFVNMTKTPLQSMEEVQAFALREAAARSETTTVKPVKDLPEPDIEGEGVDLPEAGPSIPPVDIPGLGLVDVIAKGSGSRLLSALGELNLPDLKVIAKQLGITTSGKRKDALIAEMNEAAENIEKDPSSAGAMAAFAAMEELIKDPELRAFAAQGDKVARSANPIPIVPRFDLTGMLGRSKSPFTRALAYHLGTESVGLEGGATAPVGAYQAKRQLHGQYWTQAWQVIQPAFKEYLEDIGSSENLLTRMPGSGAYQAFQEEVYIKMKDWYPGRPVNAGVAKAAKALADVYEKIHTDAQQPGWGIGDFVSRSLPGFENVPKDRTYVPRYWEEARWRNALDPVTGIGKNNLEKLIFKGYKKAMPTLSDKSAKKLARRFVASTSNRAWGRADEWDLAFGQNNYIKLRDTLKNSGVDEATIADVLDAVQIRQNEPGVSAHGKRRAMIDETAFIHDRDGNPFFVHDLLDKNALDIFNSYADHMAGRVALARVRIPNPAGGENIVNGIYSSAEFNALLRANRDWHIENKTPETQAVRNNGEVDYRTGPLGRPENASLRFIYDRILGVPDERYLNSNLYDMMAEWRRLNSSRLMGQVGIAQFGETSFPIAHLGLQAALEKMPTMKRIMDGDKSVLNDEFFREIETGAIGHERLHGDYYNTVDEIAEQGVFPIAHKESRWWRQFKKINRSLERAVYEYSGMSFLQQQQHRMVAGMFFNNLAVRGKGLLQSDWWNSGNKARLLQLGIDEDMGARIQAQIEKYSDTIQGRNLDVRIDRLNLHKWNDIEARYAAQAGAYRAAHKFIQSNDPTNSAWFMSHPIAKLIFQFRSFPMTAYANQFLYNVHTFDGKSFNAFMWTTVWASIMRALQVHINSMGKSSALAERYRERYLNPAELAKAGFERAGWASIIPMGVDTGASLLGFESPFNARTSGQPGSIITGNPASSMLQDFSRGMTGVTRTLGGGDMISEPEARALTRMLPLQNLIGIGTMLDTMVSPLPDKAPYKYNRY